MSYRKEVSIKEVEAVVFTNVRCDNCGREMEHVFEKDTRVFSSLQMDGALEIRFSGGYGMYIDPIGRDRLSFLFCFRCADELIAQYECFRRGFDD